MMDMFSNERDYYPEPTCMVVNHIVQGPLLLTWFNFNLSMDK